MADDIQIKVDDTGARLKLSRVPVEVRDRLRSVIPPLMKQLASLVDSNLGKLKSRKTLETVTEMHDIAGASNQIYGVVRVQSPSAKGLLPKYLEEGTAPHQILGNPILAFDWENGPSGPGTYFFRSVNHPGFEGIHYMRDAFDSMQGEIVAELKAAVKLGAAQARGR